MTVSAQKFSVPGLFACLIMALALTAACSKSAYEPADKALEQPSSDDREYAEPALEEANEEYYEASPDYAVAEPLMEASPPELAPMPAPISAPALDMGAAPDVDDGRGPASVLDDDEYKVVLSADERLSLPGLPGELRVWIGDPEFGPSLPEHAVTDETRIPALGQSAEVEAHAPGFDIDPAGPQCIKIYPKGSEVRFDLTPNSSGDFRVSADIRLYDEPDCRGAPVPKTAATLTVTVEVDPSGWLLTKASELWDVFWEQFVEFWAAFVALIFALILFLFKNTLKRRFGFGAES